jgi:uncharacterized membrane protein
MMKADGSTTLRGGTARTMTVLGVSYPIAAHLAVLSGDTSFIAASVGLLVLLVLLPTLLARRQVAWGLLLAAGAGLYVAAVRGQALLLLFLPPILINGSMAWLFGHTLRPGRMPLIERIIRALHGGHDDIDATIVGYARRLTFAWTALFAALATVNLVLAALATPGGLLLVAGISPPVPVPLEAWSLFANVLNYLIVGAMFAVEYQVRRRKFPQQSYRGFFDFLRRLSGVSAIFRPTGLRQP